MTTVLDRLMTSIDAICSLSRSTDRQTDRHTVRCPMQKKKKKNLCQFVHTNRPLCSVGNNTN